MHNLTVHKVGFKICLGEGQARRICIVEVCKDKMPKSENMEEVVWTYCNRDICIDMLCLRVSGGFPVEENRFFLMVYFVLFGAYSTWNDCSAFILADNTKVD